MNEYATRKGNFMGDVNDGVKAFEAMVLNARKTSRGARMDRLNKLLGVEDSDASEGYVARLFALQIWRPVAGSFDGLHPEYEIRDHNDKQRFLDFAYFSGTVRLAIELDGFGPHARDATRWSFSDDRRRQNHLEIDDWYVLRFSTDDLKDYPNICRQTLLRFFGRQAVAGKNTAGDEAGLRPVHRELIRLARCCDVLTATVAAEALGISERTARVHFGCLRDRGILVPAFKGMRKVRGYKLAPSYSVR